MLLPLLNWGPGKRGWPVNHGVRAPSWLRQQEWWRWLESGQGRLLAGLALMFLALVVMMLVLELARQRGTYMQVRRFLYTVLTLQWFYFLLGSIIDFEASWHAANVALVTVIVAITQLTASPSTSTAN